MLLILGLLLGILLSVYFGFGFLFALVCVGPNQNFLFDMCLWPYYLIKLDGK